MRFSAIFLVFSALSSLRTDCSHGLVHQTNFVGRFEQVEAHRFECELDWPRISGHFQLIGIEGVRVMGTKTNPPYAAAFR
jgi:hypothetical protein